MTMKLNAKMMAGLTAAAVSAALMAATPVQAESRTYPYGTYGSAKYEGIGANNVLRSVNRSTKRNQSLRVGGSERRHNFSSGNSYKSKIKISR